MVKADPKTLSLISNIYGVNAAQLKPKQLKAYEYVEQSVRTYLDTEQRVDAIKILNTKAIKSDSKNDMVHTELATNYRIKANADLKLASKVKSTIEAKKASLNRGEKLSKEDARKLKQAGKDIKEAERELAKAKDHAETALKLNPNNLLAKYNLLRLTDPENKTKGLEKITKTTPVTLNDHIAISYAYSILGQHDQKLEVYRKLTIDPKYSNHLLVYFNYGTYLKKAQNYPEAEIAFRKVVELAPDLKTGHYNLGIALVEQEKYEEAEAEFKKVLKLSPQDFQSLEELAGLKESVKEYDESIKYRLATLKLKPDHAASHHALSVCYKAKGEYEKALAALDDALKYSPHNVLYLCTKAQTLSHLGRDKEALECINEAYKHKEDIDAGLEAQNKHYISWIFTEQRQELLAKINELEKVAEPVTVGEADDAFQKDYATALNKEIAQLAPEIQTAAHNALMVISADQGDVQAQVGVAQQIIVRIQPVIGKRDALEIFMAHKASHPFLGDYIHGVSMTLTSTYTAAQSASAGMSVDIDTMLSNAAGAASMLPFGGAVFSLLQAGLEARQEIKVKTKFGYFSSFASNPMEASRWSMEVCNKLAENLGKSILAMDPKKGAIKKLADLFNKLAGDSETYTYDNPWKALGHTHASIAVKEMSRKPAKSAIKPQPYDDLPDRIFEFIAKNAFKGEDLGPGIEFMAQEVRIALGEVKVDLDGALD